VEGDPRTRPEPGVLVVPGTEELLHDVAMRHLGRADGWYRRAGRIVQAGQDDHGKPKIIPVSAARFTSRLSSIVRWQKINAEGDALPLLPRRHSQLVIGPSFPRLWVCKTYPFLGPMARLSKPLGMIRQRE
jgi:hypothetical protein